MRLLESTEHLVLKNRHDSQVSQDNAAVELHSPTADLTKSGQVSVLHLNDLERLTQHYSRKRDFN